MMSSKSAVFVGDGTLLIRCAQAWQEAGHAIACVVSHNNGVIGWAGEAGLPHHSLEEQDPVEIPPGEFDYLFSIAHLRMLPDAITRRARRLAVNFHDGPLPRHAGLHAPAWALMALETSHGVTWHEMTHEPDAGRIVQQELFAIAPDETALGLNARCYEAGLSAFQRIAADAARGELSLAPQSGKRSYHARHERPAALGTLDFRRDAASLAALVRALDFGAGYANPLARAKVLLGSGIALVREARVTSTASSAAPGTVLRAELGVLEVATARGDLLLSGCTDAWGHGITPHVRAGDVLPALDGVQARFERALPAIARGEPHWMRALHELAPVELPYPRRLAAAAASASASDNRAPVPGARPHGATTAAALGAWPGECDLPVLRHGTHEGSAGTGALALRLGAADDASAP
jgi:methionyl-tRNA formyltransferase